MYYTCTRVLLADPEVHPQPETYWGHVNPIGPRACYDEGKRVAETMCYAYQKQVCAGVQRGLHRIRPKCTCTSLKGLIGKNALNYTYVQYIWVVFIRLIIVCMH